MSIRDWQISLNNECDLYSFCPGVLLVAMGWRWLAGVQVRLYATGMYIVAWASADCLTDNTIFLWDGHNDFFQFFII